MSDTVIVGGGLAGGAAATLLAQSGARPLLLERDVAPRDKICGEFLSVEAQAHLTALGLDLAPLGAARIDRVRIAAGARSAEARLPFTALGLTRRRLDAALLAHAEAAGAKVERGAIVRSIAAAKLDSSLGELRPEALLLASGKHDVRGAKRDPRGTIDDLIGFKQYFRLAPGQRVALGGYIEIVLFDGGYAGLQLVERGIANLCLLVTRRRYSELGNWDALLAALIAEPHLARRLEGAEPQLAKPLTISGVPYGFVHRAAPGETVFRLGDQAGVIPSYAGDGMAIALHSGRLAAQARLAGADAAAYHARLAGDIGRQIGLATRLQRIGNSAAGRWAVMAALGLVPGAIARIAAWTRVPPPALRRAGLEVDPARA